MMWAFIRPDAVAVLKDKKARKSLARYFDVMEDKKHAKFIIAKHIEADFSEDDPTEELWSLHEKLTEEYYRVESKLDRGEIELQDLGEPERSYLDLKAELARRILSSCHLCVRRCGVNRLEGQLGYCRCGLDVAVSTYFHHMGEEPELVPSGTVFTCGCTMTCVHCQNWSISQWYEPCDTMNAEELARVVEHLRRGGCRNLNMVGGEPTPWLWQWIETFRRVGVNVPTVWNSNSYYSEETAKLLAGFIDVYLLDFKYGNDECAKRISDAPGYWEACTRNHLYALRYGELIIRILVLPDHLDCCLRPILEWIAENLGTWVRVNVMFQYRPEFKVFEVEDVPELRRRLNGEERRRALEMAREVGLENFIT